MDKPEILAFLQSNPLCFMATTEGNQPRVRGMDAYRADENGIIFYSDKLTEKHKQLVENPETEICFCDLKNLAEVRVSGRIELVDDLALKKEIVAKRPFLKPIIEKIGYDVMSVYRLKNGKATYWSMQEMGKPKTYVDL